MKNNKLHTRLVQIPWVFYPFPIEKEIVIKHTFQDVQGVLAKVNYVNIILLYRV